MKGFARRLTVVPTLFLAFSLALNACQRPQDLLGQIKSKGVVRVSTDPNYAPQSFVNAGGEFDGFDVDTAKEIARRLGVKLRLVTPEWDVIVAGNWRGQWDLSVGSMTITPERQQFLLFSPPYYSTALGTDLGISFMHDLLDTRRCVSILLAQLWQSI